MGGQSVELEVIWVDGRVRLPPDLLREKFGERQLAQVGLGRHGVEQLARPVGGGHDVAADRLRQRLEQRRHELVPQAGHQPVEAALVEARQQRQRHGDGDAVVGGTGLEAIADRERLVTQREPGRVGVGVVLGLLLDLHEVGAAQREQVGMLGSSIPPPPLEAAHVGDVCGNAFLEELDDALVVEQDVAAPAALLELLELTAQGRVVAQEGGDALVEPADIPVALDERVADEQLARERHVEARELGAPPRHDRHAEEGDLLGDDGGTLFLLPPRLAELTLGEVARERLGPRGVDDGDRAGEEAARLDELGGHDGVGLLLGEPRAGEEHEAALARAEVVALRGVFQADVAEEPGEDRLVDRCRIGSRVAVGGLLSR